METGGRPEFGVCAAVDVHYLSIGGARVAAALAAVVTELDCTAAIFRLAGSLTLGRQSLGECRAKFGSRVHLCSSDAE
jgi:hypothetical protein